MASLRTLLPYHLTPEANLAKVQCFIDLDHKRRIISAMGGNDSILTLIIQSAFLRTHDFIVSNKLDLYDPESFARIIHFVRYGTDLRATGDSASHSVASRGTDSQPTPPTARVPAGVVDSVNLQGDGTKVKAKEDRKHKIRSAAKRGKVVGE